MVFDAPGLINLILYCAQQWGMALGLGAQTILLVAYVSAMRDGSIDGKEAQFLRATRATLWVALALIALSGIVITVLAIMAGQLPAVLSSAYLFKILLIIAVIALTALLHTFPETIAEGLLGGTWYALFLVHILRPDASWANLFLLWGIWLVGFNLLWYAIVFSTREKKNAGTVRAAAPAPSKAPALKSVPLVEVKSEPPQPVIVPAAFKPIKIDPLPKAQPMAPLAALPADKMPASKATDTPFLPQVPPLQPIPVIPAAAHSAPTASVEAPVPPAPQATPGSSLGIQVMPKSPDQLNQ